MTYEQFGESIKANRKPVGIRVWRGDNVIFQTSCATAVVTPRPGVIGIKYGNGNLTTGIIPTDEIEELALEA